MPALWAAGGALIGGGLSFFGAQDSNRQQEAAAARQNEYNKAIYKYQWQEQKSQYRYAKDGLEIAKRNNEANLQFQEAQAWQQYNYQMGIRDYEFAQANRVYE